MFSPKSQVLSGSSTILPLVELSYVKEALGFPGSSVVKNLPTNTGDTGLPGLGRSLEGGMTIDSGTLPWEIPWTEESEVLQSKGLQKSWT